ncbi:MAG: ATP synthase F0 subunit C [Actinomycetota bacterium]|nr:ATP synthase F0 subunit C [Actinomycetota bacterium]
MTSSTVIIAVSVIAAAFAIAIGAYSPAKALGESLSRALDAIARQPEAGAQIARTLFVGMALIESIAIYAFVIALIILFANPLMSYVAK